MHANASKANDVYAYVKDAHDAYAIFQSRKTRKFIKNKRFEIFEFCQLEHLFNLISTIHSPCYLDSKFNIVKCLGLGLCH